MDKRFLQEGFDNRLSHLMEECAEVISAAAKTQRWGRESYNPLLPIEERELNEDWLWREIQDVILAAERLMECWDD